MIDIEIAESAILAKLQKLDTEIKHVDRYAGQINDIEQKITFAIPAALVIYGGTIPSMAEARDGPSGNLKVTFSIFIVGKNLRGKKEAAADVKAALKASREALNGLKIISENLTRTLLWQSESFVLITNTGVCVYEQSYFYNDFL